MPQLWMNFGMFSDSSVEFGAFIHLACALAIGVFIYIQPYFTKWYLPLVVGCWLHPVLCGFCFEDMWIECITSHTLV